MRDQKRTLSLIASSAFFGTTLRATKSFQSLKRPFFVRASMIDLARAGPICGSLSSSFSGAVLRFTSWACAGRAGPLRAEGCLESARCPYAPA